MNEDLVESISCRMNGSVVSFNIFMKNMLDLEFIWHSLRGLKEPTLEAKEKLTCLYQAFWQAFLKGGATAEQVDNTVTNVVCGIIDLIQFARTDPVLYGNFANWMIREMSYEVGKVFVDYPEAKSIYDSFILMAQHELNTPLGALAYNEELLTLDMKKGRK